VANQFRAGIADVADFVIDAPDIPSDQPSEGLLIEVGSFPAGRFHAGGFIPSFLIKFTQTHFASARLKAVIGSQCRWRFFYFLTGSPMAALEI
jgi:hypothetical protein